MLSIILSTICISLIIGGIIKLILPLTKWDTRITHREYLITSLAIALVLSPFVAYIGWEVGKTNKSTFEQYVNGWETGYNKETITCHRDGSCNWTYQCDPYVVMVSYSCMCDSKGRCSTCQRLETRYHDCPYCTYENNYYVMTALGNYTIDTYRLPNNPYANEWRKGNLRERIIERAGVGDPKFWLDVKFRIDSTLPGPVTRKTTYTNYVLASDYSILKKYEGDINYYKDLKLIPSPQSPIYDLFRTNKIAFVGPVPKDRGMWQIELEYLNAALGTLRQGDLHIVIAQNDIINRDFDRYAEAVRANWLSWTYNGNKATGKNSIIIIIGTQKGETIDHIRAFTGMPKGNELLLNQIQSQLKGKLLDANIVLGQTRFSKGKTTTNGILSTLTFRQDDTKFTREEMSKYAYLKGEIQPSESSKKWVFWTTMILCCLAWLAPVVFETAEERQARSQKYNNYRKSLYRR